MGDLLFLGTSLFSHGVGEVRFGYLDVVERVY